MRHEGGFTLPELAVAIMVMLIIGAAVLTFIVVTAHQYSGQEDRVTTTDEARNALMRITNELRDAGAVIWVDQRTVQAEVREADGTFRQVTFSCEDVIGGTSRCISTDVATSDEEVLVEGVLNNDNFRLITGSDLTGTASQGGAVEVRLELDLEDAENPIALNSAVRPRNCSDAVGVINTPCS